MTDHLHPEAVVRAAYADGVLHREQAGLFTLTPSEVRAQLAASRWTLWGDHVLMLHNGPPTRRQLMWVALLDAGWPSALVAHTSLELADLRAGGTTTGEADVIRLSPQNVAADLVAAGVPRVIPFPTCQIPRSL